MKQIYIIMKDLNGDVNMSNKGIVSSILDGITLYYGIKVLLPIFIIIILILWGIQSVYSNKIIKSEDADKILLWTELDDTIKNTAKENLMDNVFEINFYDSPYYDNEVIYYFKNKNYTKDEYNKLIKEQVTRIYNSSLKDKRIIMDSLFRNKEPGENPYHFVFFYEKDSGYVNSHLGTITLRYDNESGYNNSYNDSMSKDVLTNEVWNKLNNEINKEK